MPTRPPQRPDPWEAALSRHFAGEPAGAAGPRPPGLRPRAWLLAAAGVIVLLAGGLAWALVVAQQNHERGAEWRDRSRALSALVDERTRALNRQTARLNAASLRLRRAERAVRRSEADVADLERRQRELAAEKAALEDARAALEGERSVLIEQRSALEGVAGSLLSCNASMRSVLEVVVNGWYLSDAEAGELVSACDAADAELGAYLAAYGP